jgi:hypothetical protein
MDNMKAIPSPDSSGSETRYRVRRAPAFLLPALLVMAVQVAAAQEQTAAVLKLHELDFVYHGSAAVLSCSALQRRVASVLRALGAREDVEVRVTDCDAVVAPLGGPEDTWPTESDPWRTPSDPWATSSDRWQSGSDRLRNRATGRKQSAHVRVRVMMPVEVTSEVLAEVEKDKARRDLVSRVTGNPAASFDDPIVFPAQRQTVTLSRRTIGLEPEECELLQQMSQRIFKKLDMRVIRRGPSCDRDQVSHIPPQLTVEALMPVMPNVPQLLMPEEGESEAEEGDSSSEDADSRSEEADSG